MKALFVASLAALSMATSAFAAPVTVELDGVRSRPGSLYVSVQTRDQFMQNAGTASSIVTAPQAGAHRFSFELPAGEYAISVWHDDNGNGAFDKDERFMPLDGWAMSNGDQLHGEPAFDDVRIVVGTAPTAVRLGMTYGR